MRWCQKFLYNQLFNLDHQFYILLFLNPSNMVSLYRFYSHSGHHVFVYQHFQNFQPGGITVWMLFYLILLEFSGALQNVGEHFCGVHGLIVCILQSCKAHNILLFQCKVCNWISHLVSFWDFIVLAHCCS